MSKYPGRRISATPPSVSTSAASGVWTLEEVAQYRQAGTWPVGVSGADPNFNQTVLLLHGDGNQGANNLYNPGPPRYLAFTDNSDNNFPITVNGDAYGDNFSPFMTEAGQWSVNFTGSNYFTVPDSAGLELGSSNFTIECWFYPTAVGNYAFITKDAPSGTRSYGFIAFNDSGALKTTFFIAGGAQLNSTATLNINAWNFVTVTRSGNTLYMSVNGTVNSGSWTSTIPDNAQATFIGAQNGPGAMGNFCVGHLSNLRLVIGESVSSYQSNFTPPTSPASQTSGGVTAGNTKLLVCQSNRFVDNAATPNTITVSGTPLVKPFNPFTTTYSSTNGSGYFDGTGDYLTIPYNAALQLGSSDFTIDFWFYSSGPQGAGDVIANGYSTGSNLNWLIQADVSTVKFFASTTGTTWAVSALTVGTIVHQSWNHFAITRSGNTVTPYLNGVAGSTATLTGSVFANTSGIAIATDNSGTSTYPVQGFISNFRMVIGSAIAPPAGGPTAPATNVTNTQLLTCQYQGSVRNVGFIDSSPYDHVITRNPATGPNAPTQGTFSPFSAEPGKWSNFFDGANNTYLSIANTADLDQSGDFTQEVWYCRTADGFGSVDVLFIKNITNYLYIGVTQGTGVVTVNQHNIGTIITGTTATAIGVWYHLAVTRSGSSVRLFVNGVQEGSTVTYSTNTTGTAVSYIGGFPSAHAFAGYLSNLRVVAGRAVYTSNFTPSTSPLGLTSGGTNPPQGSETKLLTCFDNRFVDNSSSPKIITRNGDVRVTPFSPFAPSAAYSPSVNGGSGYFDGSGDYLLTTSAAALAIGTSAFTLEGWCYFNNVNTNGAGFGTCAASPADASGDRGVSLFLTGSGAWRFRVGRSFTGQFEDFLGTTTLVAGQWYHFKMVRTSTGSNDTRIYLNGVQEAIGTSTISLNMQKFSIGTYSPSDATTGALLNGYAAGIRFTNTAESSAIPTAPPTAVSGTQYLCNFTNAGIFDQTGKNVLETVGNAQVDTSVKKFGTGSMKFDGTGDYLLAPHSVDHLFGTGQFTIEMWIYANSVGLQAFIGKGTAGSTGWAVGISSTSKAIFYYGSTSVSSSASLTSGTWTHIAVVREGTGTNQTKIYINGTNDGTATVSTDFTQTNPMYIGTGRDGSGTFNGYIDDLRLTKGVARWTTNFTPPTIPYLDQ